MSAIFLPLPSKTGWAQLKSGGTKKKFFGAWRRNNYYHHCAPPLLKSFRRLWWPWPFNLQQLSCMAGHVVNLVTKYEDPTHIRSWVMSYNVSGSLPLKMRTRPLRMRRITWVGGQKQLHFWNPRPRFAYSLYNFYWTTTTIKARLLSNVTNDNALDCVNFLCDLDLWPFNLEHVLVHGGSRGQPCHQVWRPYDYSFMSYEL